jgi:hypothetical protein
MEETAVAETQSEASPTETPAISEQATEQPQLSKAFIALSKKESALRVEREKFAQEKKEIEAIRAELDAERSKYRALKENPDPIEALKIAGLDYHELTRRIANSGTPEAQIEQLRAELKKRDEDFEKFRGEFKSRDEAERKAKEEQAEKAKQAQESQALHQAKQDFAAFVESNWNKYPNLSEYDPEDVGEAAVAAANSYVARHGRPPSNPDVLAAELEKIAADKKNRMTERASKRKPPEAPQARSPATDTEESEIELAKARAKAKRPNTLTNKVASETTGAPRAETREARKARLAARL